MKEVQFLRGIKNNYIIDAHKDAVYFATDSKEIFVNGVSYGSVDIDTELTATSLNPVTSAGIYAGVQSQIDKTMASGDIPARIEIRDEGYNTYRLYLLNKDGEVISKSETTIMGEQSSDIKKGGVFFNLNGSQDKQIKKGQDAEFSFYYDRRNDDGYSTANSAIVRLFVGTSTEGEYIKEFKVEANSNFEVVIPEDNLTIGSRSSYSVQLIPLQGDIELVEEAKSIPVTVMVIDFTLLLNGYQLSNTYSVGDVISVPYRFSGYAGLKTVKVYVDGVNTDINGNLYPEHVTTEGDTFVISTEGWDEGTHNILLLASYESETQTIYSNLIYIAVPVSNSKTVFGAIFDMEDREQPLIVGLLPVLNVQLYQSFSFDFIVTDNTNSRVVKFYSLNVLSGDFISTSGTTTLNYKYNDTGIKLCKLVCGNQEYSFNINVVQSEYNIYAPGNASLYLNALGKSNNSESKDSWNYNNITSTFENFKWGSDGWQNVVIKEFDDPTIDPISEPALRLISGDKVTINYKPFQSTSTSNNSFACNIRFKVSQVADESETLISCIDDKGIGFEIKANEAYIKTYEGQVASTKFAPGEVYNIGFVVFPGLTGSDTTSKVNSNRVYLYVNGTICSTALKSNTDSIYQVNPVDITILSEKCILDIFSIRCYSQLLSDSSMFDLYLIDLNDPDKLISEYESNQVLDTYGNVSLDKALNCGIPCMIITGQGEGYNAVDYVAAKNDKDFKFDIDEILYLESNEASERNFLVVKGSSNPQLRLQGTSSLNYAIKNYRIYSKKAKLFVNIDYDMVYKSVDALNEMESNGQITAQEDPVYSLYPESAPVNCWCLKADFAEASSSHNTGFARMVHDLLSSVNSLTPPLQYVSEDYPYQVRTTIDGHPCLLFARKTTADTPVFAGKFNFNNDKSTEDVFGFLDIPGYHDTYSTDLSEEAIESLWFPEDFTSVTLKAGTEDEETFTKEDILALLEGNPTECWEFLNNENSFGDFKDIDFTEKITVINSETGKEEIVYKWMNMWEARFPDEDALNAAFEAGVQPKYLKAIAEWLVSTDTEGATNESLTSAIMYNGVNYTTDSAEYRKAKFANEVSNYFNVTFLCDYYTLNDCVAGADQRKKNMMWAFWHDPRATFTEDMGRMRCYIIYYDNDTILGVDNSGAITIPWNADENSMYASGSYMFAGHNSVLWNNVRTCLSSELRNSYRKLRAVMNNTYMKEYFNEKQSEVYGEVVFNKDTFYKYVQPTVIGTPKIQEGTISNFQWDSMAAFVHGTRKAHRDWFIGKRMEWFDNRYGTGSFTSNEINFKGALPEGFLPSLSLISATDAYYAVASDEGHTIDTTHTKVLAGGTFTFASEETPGPGATYKLYGIGNMKELDLSNWGGYNLLTLGNCPMLEKFILGGINAAPVKVNPSFGSNMPQLKYLDVTNTTGNTDSGTNLFTTLNVSLNLNLETLIANLCPNLTTVNFAAGGAIKDVTLPSNYENLYLDTLPYLTNSGIKWETSAASVTRLYIGNCPNIDPIALLYSIMNTEGSKLSHIRIDNVSLSGDGSDLVAIYNKGIKGLEKVGSTYLTTDKCKITGTYKLTTLLDNSVYIELCTYFDELNIQQPEYTIISFNCAQATSEKITNYDNKTGYEFGNTYSPSGHITKILDQRHSYLVKYPTSYSIGEFAAIQLDDSNSTKFIDGTDASLDGTYGDFCMYEPHYWYKGVNDHKKLMLYLLLSSNKECPEQAVGKKITISDCELKSGYGASTGKELLTDSQSIVAQSDYNLYSYTLPEEHSYKQFRVSSVNHANFGCIVVDKNGNILLKLSLASDVGMYDTSYLFDSLSENAYKIYITIDKSVSPEYCLYLTESVDIEAIEPDWVEHKECFVGRVFSTKYNNEVKAAIYDDIHPETWTLTGFYPQVTGLSVKSVNDIINNRGKGYYYAADYEVFKDIMNLAYAKYGSTGLHSNCVGAGAFANGKFGVNSNNTSCYIAKYFPDTNVKNVEFGIDDTITDSTFESYYLIDDDEKKYPGTATLMGYYHFVGLGTMTSYSDKITLATKMYSNERTGRSLKLYTGSSAIYNKYIIGGRYFDIFGATTQTKSSSSNDGFCGREFTTNNASISALSIGYVASSSGVYSYNLEATYKERVSVETTIGYNNISNAQRILIVPDKVTYFNTISEYNSI